MLRGFRWQLLALFLAIMLFGIALVTTSDDEPTEDAPTPAATQPVVPPQNTVEGETPAPPIPTQAQPFDPTADNIPTYREALVGSVQRLNPLYADLNPADRDITSLIFEGLTRRNRYGEPEPALAREWVISFDQLEYVITLRDDVLWQDGVPFTAADVMYTMSILSSPEFSGPTELGAFWRTVEVEQLGDHLVRFRLAQPLGSFLDALRIGILPYHALQGATAADLPNHLFNLSPIGTGPYQLEALRTSASGRIEMVDLRVAPVYRQRPEGQTGYAMERLRFHLYDSFEAVQAALQAGDIDGYAGRSRAERDALLRLDDRFSNYTTVEPAVGFLIFNWQRDGLKEEFGSLRVRQALLTGLDRAPIIARNLANTAILANSPILPGSWAYQEVGGIAELPYPGANVNLARTLIAQANIEAGDAEATEEAVPAATQTPALFRFTILVWDDPAIVNVAQEIATQWSQLGVAVTVQSVDRATYRQRLESGDFDAAIAELSKNGSTDPDVYTFWHQGQYPDGQNYGGADDRTISELLELGRRDWNGINRAPFYTNFQREFIQRAIAIPLYYPLFTYVASANVDGVQVGFIGSEADRFQSIQNWAFF